MGVSRNLLECVGVCEKQLETVVISESSWESVRVSRLAGIRRNEWELVGLSVTNFNPQYSAVIS